MSERTDTSRSGDLVERLRERTCVVFNSPGVHPDTECLEAADRIEALEAENARLREALSYYADEFCELTPNQECCGRLTKWECSGCFARKALGDTHD